ASHRAADLDLLQPQFLDLAGDLAGDHLVFADDHFVGDRVDDVGPADAAENAVGQAHLNALTAVDHALGNTLRRAAVVHGDDHVLGHVGQLTGEVTRVGRLEGRIGQTLTGTVRGAEVLQHAETFTEVGLNGRFDNLARGLGHQTTHTGQLTNLLDTTTSTGVRHQVDGVHIAGLAAVVLELRHHLFGDLLTRVSPGIKHLVVALHIRDDAAAILAEELEHRLLGGRDDLGLARRRDQVVGRERQTAAGAPAEP